jgi:uncharacterized protein
MRWRRGGGRDSDLIDLRGGGGGLGRGGLPVGRVGGGVGLVGVLVVLALQLLGGGGAYSVPTGFDDGTGAPGQQPIPAAQDPERDLRDFSLYVFSNANDTWAGTFRRQGRRFKRARLVLYRSGVRTGGCGSASSAVGPFYCPGDGRVYLDLSFYDDMASQLGASGDFAWAYVIAHEVGHHVQSLRGTSEEVRRLQRADPDQANALSVRLELQADCYAGVWAHAVFDQLDQGDVEEAIAASEAVGDDRLQRRAGGSVRPDSFTHGTSEQRARWFSTGQASGEPADCDPFSVADV